MMMLSTRVAVAAAFAQLAQAGLYPGISDLNHTCILDKPELSCSSKAEPGLVDTCCSETFGGLLLQTQLWSTFTGREAEGQVYPEKSWTIHGLWPDFCNGSYTQYCDLSRQYDPKPSPNTTNGEPNGTPVPAYTGKPIEQWFKPYGKLDLLAFMNKYWINQFDPNWEFWAHEFSKHATCYSTFQKECFGPKAARHDDLFEFYETVITWWKDLPTFDWLAARDITPSNRTAYSLHDIQSAIKHGFGQMPYISCYGPRYNETAAGKGSLDNGRTQLSEVWYYHHTLGRPQDHHAVRVSADVAGGSLTSCATSRDAIWYYERSKGSEVAY